MIDVLFERIATMMVTPHLFNFGLNAIGCAVFSALCLYGVLHSPLADLFKDKPDPRKVHNQPIPRIGGVVIILSFIVFATSAYFTGVTGGFDPGEQKLFYGLIFSSFAILVLGFFDDTTFIVVRARHKIAIELLIAFTVVYLCDINIGELSIFGLLTFPKWFSNVVSFLWILGLANAYNIIDGMDGLAGTLAFIAFITLSIFGFAGATSFSLLFTLLLAGAVAGFLLLNLPPAKTFMGDTGSIFIGTMIAILTLFIGRQVVPEKAIIIMPLIAGIPILEVLITMIRRFCKARDKKKSLAAALHSMVIPDNLHMHHRLLYKGYTAAQSVSLLALLGGTLSLSALGISFVNSMFAPVILLYVTLPLGFMLYHLGFGGRFKKALRISKTRYNGFKKTSLIGLIDQAESLYHKLDQQTTDGVSYIKIAESDIPAVHLHLRAAVVKECTVDPNQTIKKAESISAMLKGPVYVIEDTVEADFIVREVSRNGRLSILEKRGTTKGLLKDFKELASKERIRHHDIEELSIDKSEPVTSVNVDKQ